jgi:hypothetical protein
MLSQAFHMQVSEANWRDPDLSVLDSRRGPVPAVPLELLPQPWRDWVGDTERATGAPADYVLQSVLAGVAAACGAGVVVRATPAWSEPLVLWLAAVGEPSTGKSAALAPMRRLLDVIEQERRLGDEERRAAHDERSKVDGGSSAAVFAPFIPSQVVAADDDPATLIEIVSGNPRGLLLWRDGPAAWIGGEMEDDRHRATWLAAWDARAVAVMRPRRPPRSVRHFPVSVVETVRPERLKASLEAGGDSSLAARFLFAWPVTQPYRALAVVERSRDEAILQRLRALSRLGGGADDPHVIEVDARGRAALDGVLATLHAERQKAEGPEATWLGTSRSLIVRLAGILVLLGSIDGKVVRPGAIGKEQVEAAATLWRVRRVARWLLATQAKAVSREEVRRRALCQAATADETQYVLERLAYLGFVRADLSRERVGRAMAGQPGPRRNRKTGSATSVTV